MTKLFNNLKNIERKKIIDCRDFENDIFLNRAERVEQFDKNILQNIFNPNNFLNLGNYFDIDKLYVKYSNYLKINKENLLITNGAEDAIRYIFNILLNKDDIIMFPVPTYGMYHVFSKIYQVNKIILEYNKFKIDKEKLYLNLPKVKIFFLPNPSHIEDLFFEEEIIKICKILEQNNGFLVLDETYYGFGSPSMIKLINKINNIFIIQSFSKTFGLPSIRVGCLISNKNIISTISNYRPAYEISYPCFKIAEYFLDNIDITNNYIKKCIEGRQYLISEFKKNNIIYNGKNNYLLNIDMNNKNCEKICSNLEKNHIYVRNCKTYISITIGPIEYMSIFLKKFIKIYFE